MAPHPLPPPHNPPPQLLMRTYFADYKLPHASDDWVAADFRDRIMPHEAAMVKAAGM